MKLTLNQILTFNVVIFSLVAIIHLLRILLNWDLILNYWQVSKWVSILAILIAVYLAYNNNVHRK